MPSRFAALFHSRRVTCTPSTRYTTEQMSLAGVASRLRSLDAAE